MRAFTTSRVRVPATRSNPWIRERLGELRYRLEYRQWWIRRFDRLRRAGDSRDHDRATAHLAHQPLLSVIMPVYNSDERWLRAAISRSQDQLYTNWELCIADDHSSDPRVAGVLREISAREPRLKLHFRDVNGHISAASNSALALATGEFIVLLDHDDVLPAHALAAVVHELNRHPDADIVYSDEDRLDQSGTALRPLLQAGLEPGAVLRPEPDQPPRRVSHGDGQAGRWVSRGLRREPGLRAWRCG